MYITHQGKALDMNATIESSNIKENDTVMIALKGKGGSEEEKYTQTAKEKLLRKHLKRAIDLKLIWQKEL